MTRPRILLLEDDAADVFLITREFRRGGVEAEFVVAQSREEFLGSLEQPVDIVISDSSVPGLPPLDALHLASARQPQSAFIILSGVVDVRQAARARQAGAVDWLEKGDLPQLVPVVTRLLGKRTLQQQALDDVRTESRQLQRGNRSAMRLVQAVRDLSAARDLATVQEIVRHAARELNGADGATFVLREGDQCHYADEDAIGPLWKGQRFPMSACISGWAMMHGKPAVVPDIAADPRIPLDAYRPTFVRSLVMVPIRPESPIGAIGNYWASERMPTDEEVSLIQALADSTSIALENVQLYGELEARVARRTAELKDANQALEEFSYFASHDLRAPLRHIHAFTDILRSEHAGMLDDAGRHALERIKFAALTMAELLQGLLDLAYAGQQALRQESVDMTALARDAVALVRDHAGNGAEFRIGALPAALGDPALLRQVLSNLVGNAAKFSSSAEKPLIEIGAETDEGETRYFVRDNGVGFDMAEAQHLFSAFRRLESGSTFPGSGVGLAIVHRIVARHGGRIWAESAPGRGAAFWFVLPPG